VQIKRAFVTLRHKLRIPFRLLFRNQSSPDTFDKRVARVNMETKVTQLHEYYVWSVDLSRLFSTKQKCILVNICAKFWHVKPKNLQNLPVCFQHKFA
jgi:hypothetical protein